MLHISEIGLEFSLHKWTLRSGLRVLSGAAPSSFIPFYSFLFYQKELAVDGKSVTINLSSK